MARIIPSDFYYRRQSTPVGPTGVVDTADSDSDSDTVAEASPEVESEFSEEMKIESVLYSTWRQEYNWGNLVATHFKGQYCAVALSVPGTFTKCKARFWTRKSRLQ